VAISAETALRSDLGPWLAEFEPMLADYSFIALAFLHERRLGHQSDFADWLSSPVWPVDIDAPLSWPPAAQAELCASSSAPLAERFAALEADYAWLEEEVFGASPVFFPPSVFNKEAFTAAVALAFSRSVWIGAGEGEQPALVPLLDLPNHHPLPNAATRGRPTRKGLFGGKGNAPAIQLEAQIDISEGQPICVAYGQTTAAELLLDYGFLHEPVPAEAALLLSLDATDSNFDDKCDVVEGVGLAAEQAFVLSEDGEVSEELVAYLRLIHLKGADAFLLESIFRDVVWVEHMRLPVSQENERQALTYGLTRCSSALDGFPGSLQTDLGTLADAPRASREYKLAAIRYAERRALSAAARAFENRLGDLRNLEYYQERRLRSLNLTPVETEEELDALREESTRAAGRSYGAQDYDW